MIDRNIIWLASYPKSGNTWFRSFISALKSGKEPDLNALQTDGIYSSKYWVENILDLDASYLSDREMELYQREAIKYLNPKEENFIKIHDAYTFSSVDGQPLIYGRNIRIAIYILRNPLDVALSLANHLNKTVDVAINNFICNSDSAFLAKRGRWFNQFKQPLGTWSQHVESWLKYPEFPVHFVRYEDLKEKPFETFSLAIKAAGLTYSPEVIQKAIDLTAFERLKAKEQQFGFKEKLDPTTDFFFKGQVGRWKEELTKDQVHKIRMFNEPMMRRFGYW